MILECEDIDTIFAESEQKLTEGLIKKKKVVKNAYYGTGKIRDDEKWPLRSGTRIKGLRLGRIGIPDCTGWRPVEDALCSTNACSFEPDVIQHGHGDYYFSLVQKDLRTDWLCIDSLAMREMPEDEVMHLEDGLQKSSRYVHEEFRRSRYLLFGRNKIIALVPNDDDTGLPVESSRSCDNEIRRNAYLFEARDNGEMDECHIRVAVNPTYIANIAELSLDMLDYAAERLAYEDDSYLDGVGLYDVLMASQKMFKRLALQEDQDMGRSPAQGGSGWNLVDLSQEYGTEGVLRNYSLRTDIHAMRFYPDNEYNDGEGNLETPFDLDNPSTWPRFVRVFPYKPVAAKVAGIEFITNEDYLNAPFGISTILSNRVMRVMSFPRVQRVAGATKVGGFGYEGTVQWQNPPWPCNPNGDQGFWKMRFRMSAKQDFDEEGYSWFHRIDRRLSFIGNPCTVPDAPCDEEVTAYCFSGMGGAVDSGQGENRKIDQSI